MLIDFHVWRRDGIGGESEDNMQRTLARGRIEPENHCQTLSLSVYGQVSYRAPWASHFLYDGATNVVTDEFSGLAH